MSSIDNKNIAKNTLFMYFRMFLQMCITLYTTRVVLNILGVEDFGLYNVIGGVVGMLGFFRSTMSIATQRFMSYEIGLKNDNSVRNVFSCSVIGHIILSLIVFIIAETIGLWFIRNKLVIPEGDYNATFFVYQTVIISFVINLIVVPYNSAIIAYEKFSFFAFLSVSEVLLKLLLLWLLYFIDSEKLKLYSLLMLGVNLSIAIIYIIYCIIKFKSCRLKWINDTNLYRQLFSFSGWIFVGDMSFFASTQGVNLLINVFFGPAVNAARAISEQVNQAVTSFASNFMLAIRPTITKKYAENSKDEAFSLVFLSTKFSFYLLLIFIVPIIYNTNVILSMWLGEIPMYTIQFTQLILINLLIHIIPTPLSYLVQADGNIRLHQIVVGIGFLLILLLSWFAYYINLNPLYTLYITICISILDIPVRLWVLHRLIKFPIISYVNSVIYPIALTAILSFFISYVYRSYFQPIEFWQTILFICISIIFTLGLIFICGLSNDERIHLLTMVNQRFKYNDK